MKNSHEQGTCARTRYVCEDKVRATLHTLGNLKSALSTLPINHKGLNS